MRRNKPQKRQRTRRIPNERTVQRVRAGNANAPPDNAGTVQIPRPINIRTGVTKRTFKTEYVLSTGTLVTQPVFYSGSLYAPFYAVTGTGSSYTSAVPASLANMYASFGLYKPKIVQLIVEPLVTSSVIPAPLTIAMSFDVASPTSTTMTQAQLVNYQNATKISPAFPSEVKYRIPSVAAQSSNQIVLQGGWLDTNEATAPQQYGFIVIAMASGSNNFTVSTNYVSLTVAYEIWFKNPL